MFKNDVGKGEVHAYETYETKKLNNIRCAMRLHGVQIVFIHIYTTALLTRIHARVALRRAGLLICSMTAGL